jgi:hypothetical protein
MTKFEDFDLASQKEMLERRARFIKRVQKQIEDTKGYIKDEIDGCLDWMLNCCDTEEERAEVREKSKEVIDEYMQDLTRLELKKKEISETEPHKLKLVY